MTSCIPFRISLWRKNRPDTLNYATGSEKASYGGKRTDALSLSVHLEIDDRSDALSLCSNTISLFAVSEINDGETCICEQDGSEQRSLSNSNNTVGVMPVDPRFPEMPMQPDSRPILQEQLSAEVKTIYAGLVMVESKCIRT
jgi:hypothetical protein